MKEYKTIVFTGDIVQFDKFLNEEAKEGWELCGSFLSGKLSYSKNLEITATFGKKKRAKTKFSAKQVEILGSHYDASGLFTEEDKEE